MAQGFENDQRRELIPAEAYFRRALAAAPEDSDAPRLLGEVLIDLGRYDEAVLLIQKLVAQRPDSALAFNTLDRRRSGIETYETEYPEYPLRIYQSSLSRLRA